MNKSIKMMMCSIFFLFLICVMPVRAEEYGIDEPRDTTGVESEGNTEEKPEESPEDAPVVSVGDTKVKTSPVSYKSIKISWDNVKDADGYVLYRSTKKGSKGSVLKTITSGTTVSYTDKTVKIGTTYYYSVKAYRNVDGEKIYGDLSAQKSQKAQLLAPKITSVKKSAYNYITVKWNKVSDASGYAVYRSTSEDGEYTKVKTIKSTKTLEYKDKISTCGKTYFYKVRAYRTSNGTNYYGQNSAVVSGKTTPSTIQFHTDSLSGKDYVKLYWKKSSGAKGYAIYRSTNEDSGYECVKVIESAKTLNWTQKTLDQNKVYYYKIRPYTTVSGKNVYGSYSKAYKKISVKKGLENIKKYTNVKYKSGGNNTKGWDCSGFTQWAMKYIFDVEIPKYSGDQAKCGKSISKNDMSKWQPGDILIYKSGKRVNHVALYLGNGKIMHALNKKYGTVIQDVDYYEKWDKKNNLAAVRRCF